MRKISPKFIAIGIFLAISVPLSCWVFAPILPSTVAPTLPPPSAHLVAPRPAPAFNSSDPVGDEWSMFRGQLNHTGVASPTPIKSAVPLWNASLGSYIYSSPAVTNGFVYVGCEDDRLYCLNAATGAQQWNYTMGGYVDSSPAVAAMSLN